MNATPAKKEFKKRLGQANHFLITALIGVDAIKEGIVTEKPSSFSTSWNPKDRHRSAERTRIFILKSFLGWAVESLEMYISEIYRKPRLVESPEIEKRYSKAGQSIYKRVVSVADYIGIDPILTALMEVLITWRNYTFHYGIDNKIREESLACLKNNDQGVEVRFSGLKIDELQKTWESGGDFTFKETASLIKATQEFVNEIDRYLIESVDSLRFYRESVEKYFERYPKAKVRYVSYAGSKKEKYLRVLLQNIVGETDIEDSLITKLVEVLNL